MVRRVSENWVANGNREVMDLVFQFIGVNWPINKREQLLQLASDAIFTPENKDNIWEGHDQSHLTVNKEPYYPVTILLNQTPTLWFKNLRLLQVRWLLNLGRNFKLNLDQGLCKLGIVFCKLQAIEKIIGTEAMKISHVPNLRRPNRIGNARAESLRRSGLRARQT